MKMVKNGLGWAVGLGRLRSEDDRDHRFPMSAVIDREAADAREYRYWYANAYWGDQGQMPWCVDFAWHHWAADGPVVQARDRMWDPGFLYNMAQQEDGFPLPHDGTTVRAAAKVMQRLGMIDSYHWAFDAPTAMDAVLGTGPVVLGTNWYDSMFEPDRKGMVTIPDTAHVVGGHAYLLDGVNMETGVVRCKNSWSREWGDRGFFHMFAEDLARLINEDGEACIAVERKSQGGLGPKGPVGPDIMP